MTTEYTDPTRWLFVIGLLKGAVEGDPYQHFGSLFGFKTYLADAQRVGLVDSDGLPTDAGQTFYAEHGLAGLPVGRAYFWGDHPVAVKACAALDAEELSR